MSERRVREKMIEKDCERVRENGSGRSNDSFAVKLCTSWLDDRELCDRENGGSDEGAKNTILDDKYHGKLDSTEILGIHSDKLTMDFW